MQKVLQRVLNREPSLYDLIINVPPGESKSTICSVFSHVWLWIKAPRARIISASHDEGLAILQSLLARDVFESKQFNELFPHKVIFKRDQNNKSYYKNINGGSRRVASIGANVTGFHGDVLLLDDLVNPKSVNSEAERPAANTWLDESASTRKTNKANTPTILIMQRLHEMDPTGHWLKKAKELGKRIKHICIPADDSLDNIRPKKLKWLYKNGLMDPVRMPRQVLNDMKIDLTENGYSGQALQSPVAPGGNIIKRDWIQGYTELPKQRPISTTSSWDTAYKKGKKNSHNAHTYWEEYENGYYLDDAFWEKMEYPELKDQVILEDENHFPDETLVEDKSSGTPIMQELSNNTKINFTPIEPEGDKESRAIAISPTFKSKNVYIRTNAPWSKELIENITMYPNCEIMDIMDSISQYLNYKRENGGYKMSQMKGGRKSGITGGF